jgi:peptidoglycan/xylan/chitin deacetylase (PgdA/CDA1 family)
MKMLRKLTKGGLAAGIHALGVDRIIGTGRRVQHVPLVLSYHRVVENYEASKTHSISPMLVSAATFEKQLDWIGKHYEFVSLDALGQALEAGEDLRKPMASVTFDDGYGDAYYHAFPILKRKGIPMAVFVVTDLVGSPKLQLHDELHLLLATAFKQWQQPVAQLAALAEAAGIESGVKARLCAPHGAFTRTRLCLELLQHTQIVQLVELLRASVTITADTLAEFHAVTWEMLNHMAANGVTVGSHTKSHTLLVNESWTTMLDEIRGSRAELESRLSRKVEHFAYPDGRFNSDALKAVSVAGFRYAYTTCMHRDSEHPLLTIPRRVLWENTCVDGFGRFSPSILSCQINGIFDPAAKCQQNHWTGLSPSAALGGDVAMSPTESA